MTAPHAMKQGLELMTLDIKKIAALAGGVLAAAAVPSTYAQAVEEPELTAEELGLTAAEVDALIGDLDAEDTEDYSVPGAAPGISLGSPVAFGANWGEIGFGLGGATLPSSADRSVDGSAGVVVGFGDSENAVGLEVTGNIISISDDFGHDGSFAAKLHTGLPGGAAFAVGIENIARWGRAKTTSSSLYAAASKVVALNDLTIALNGGIGENRFSDPGDDGVSPFGSIAVLPIPQLSVIADWVGNALNAGVSVAPFDALPLTVTAGVANLTERNGSDAEFTGGIGYSYSFK